ncbi:Bax inhibitor-1/YccA family protein [uncultured Cohaesibacter sp.]|uniref:Bax inhibitor-1/YccA family protein n=1 Tax=uncultured Cohaesibacter sp. TaxID=1002546 RepID=UPI0029317766|nr:Bax inhibitor-1/YccA family protein [uncultured Cohaesibacter sp.]
MSGRAAEMARIDQGLRSYMLKVYNYMAIALAVTGVFAYGMFQLSFVREGGDVVGVTQLGATLFNSPLKWVVMFAPFALVMYLSFRIHKMSASTAQMVFWIYSALMGASLTWIFAVYTMTSVTQVFFITAASFAALSLYGYTTPKSLSGWGSFLFMGLIGLVIASIVNIFLASSAMAFAISAIGVLVFAGLTAYDTQKIKEMYFEGDSSETAGKKAIMGALTLYLDFINLFLMLLRLLGNRE